MPEVTTDRERYLMLVDGLRMMAAPYELQVAALPSFVHVPDEILNTVQFDLAPALVTCGVLSREQAAAFAALNAFLDTLEERDEGPYDYDVLLAECQADPWWAELRSRALGVLELLGEPWVQPTLDGVTYVRGELERGQQDGDSA